MKKRKVILAGLLILAMSLVLMGQKAWDKTPKEQTFLLHYTSDIRVAKIDGVVYKTAGIPQELPGKGSEKKPKAIFRIPAGKHTITIRYGGGSLQGSFLKDLEYDFQAGRNYQIVAELDEEKYKANIGKAFLQDMEAIMAFSIKDITK